MKHYDEKVLQRWLRAKREGIDPGYDTFKFFKASLMERKDKILVKISQPRSHLGHGRPRLPGISDSITPIVDLSDERRKHSGPLDGVQELERHFIVDPITHTESGRLSPKTPVMMSQDRLDKESGHAKLVPVMQRSSEYNNQTIQNPTANTRLKNSLHAKHSRNAAFG